MKHFPILFVLLATLVFFDSSAFSQNGDRFQSEVDQIVAREFTRDPEKKLVVFAGSSSFRMWPDVQGAFPKIQDPHECQRI